MHADPPSSPLALAARRHADEVVKPQVRDWEAAAAFPRDAAVAAAGDGLLGLFAPGTVGGQGASLAEAMDVFEELGRGDAAYAFALSMHNAVTNTIARFGTPELSERYAPRPRERRAARRLLADRAARRLGRRRDHDAGRARSTTAGA